MKQFMLQGTSVLFAAIVSAGLTLCGLSAASEPILRGAREMVGKP